MNMFSKSPCFCRSALYVPAVNARAIEKSRTLGADAVLLDLEDAVSSEMKAAARGMAAAALANPDFGRSRRVLRINAMASPCASDDLAILQGCTVDALLLPKVNNGEELLQAARRVEALRLPYRPALWAMIETARGLSQVSEIAMTGTHVGLECLVVGTNDIAKETSVSMADERALMVPWLMNVVLAAKGSGLLVLDGVWNGFRDVEGFERELAQSRKMGFSGKTLIHPTQVAPSNRAFAPSEQAVAEAGEIVAAFALAQNQGKGVISLNGAMVELLHLESAQQLLRMYEAINASCTMTRPTETA